MYGDKDKANSPLCALHKHRVSIDISLAELTMVTGGLYKLGYHYSILAEKHDLDDAERLSLAYLGMAAKLSLEAKRSDDTAGPTSGDDDTTDTEVIHS